MCQTTGTLVHEICAIRYELHKTYNVQIVCLRPIVIIERAIVPLCHRSQIIKLIISSANMISDFKPSAPILMPASGESELQFAMSLEEPETSGAFVYESCSADYSLPDIDCIGGGDRAGQKSFSGVMSCICK